MAAVIAAPTPPAALRTEAAANWAEPANVVADITTEASPPIPAAWATSPNDAPKTTTAGAIVAARFADYVVFFVQWERTSREVAVNALKQMRDLGKQVGIVLARVNVRRHFRYGYSDHGYCNSKYRDYYAN